MPAHQEAVVVRREYPPFMQDPNFWLYKGVTWRHWIAAIFPVVLSGYNLITGFLAPTLTGADFDGSFWGVFWLCAWICLAVFGVTTLALTIYAYRYRKTHPLPA